MCPASYQLEVGGDLLRLGPPERGQEVSSEQSNRAKPPLSVVEGVQSHRPIADPRGTGSRPKDVALLAAGVVAGPVCVILMAMVIGNTQASVAPLSMTLFYG